LYSNNYNYYTYNNNLASYLVGILQPISTNQHTVNRTEKQRFKALAKCHHASAIADHVKNTGHNIKWDHFDILASGKIDFHCQIKETLFIQELKPSLNVNISSEKLLLY